MHADAPRVEAVDLVACFQGVVFELCFHQEVGGFLKARHSCNGSQPRDGAPVVGALSWDVPSLKSAAKLRIFSETENPRNPMNDSEKKSEEIQGAKTPVNLRINSDDLKSEKSAKSDDSPAESKESAKETPSVDFNTTCFSGKNVVTLCRGRGSALHLRPFSRIFGSVFRSRRALAPKILSVSPSKIEVSAGGAQAFCGGAGGAARERKLNMLIMKCAYLRLS